MSLLSINQSLESCTISDSVTPIITIKNVIVSNHSSTGNNETLTTRFRKENKLKVTHKDKLLFKNKLSQAVSIDEFKDMEEKLQRSNQKMKHHTSNIFKLSLQMFENKVCPFSSDYDILEMLGRGCSAKVFKVQRKKDNKGNIRYRFISFYYIVAKSATQYPCYILVFAAKVIDIQDDEVKIQSTSEYKILTKLNHVNIVKPYEIMQNDDQKQLIIILEYIEGLTLKKYFRQKERAKHKSIFKQLLSGLEYIHQESIVHRDLQFENVMITSEDVVKIIDFGVAREMVYLNINSEQSLSNSQESTLQMSSVIFTPTGLADMRAPEIIKFNGYTPLSDIWQLGLIFLGVLANKTISTGNLLKKISLAKAQLKCKTEEECPSEESPYQQCLSQMITKYTDRDNSLLALLLAGLQKNSEKRATATELLNLPYFL